MLKKRQIVVAVVLSLGLMLTTTQFARSLEKVTFVGDLLTNEDGPFLVNGTTEDFGDLTIGTAKTVQEAAAMAQNWLNKRPQNLQVQIVSADGKKRATANKEKLPARKKGVKEEKKAEPIPDSRRGTTVDPGPLKAKSLDAVLNGTTWIGSESASDTTSLKFIFKDNHQVIAYDDTQHTWKGTWKTIGERTVVIELTDPNGVNYSGQLEGNRLTGKAKRTDGRAQWNWSVTRSGR
jgi:hypothetical protein